MNSIEARIATPAGALYCRRWVPTQASGAPVVLLHDSLGCVESWREFPEQLASTCGREVVAYDRLGFGRSDPHPGTLSSSFVQDEAREGFRAVVDALGIERFAVFGHSVGGGMAVACAAAHAQRCVALVTESAQAFVEDRTLAGIRTAQARFAQAGVGRLAKYHGDKAAWVLRAWIDTWLAPEFASWSLDARLPGVRAPALVIHGDLDEYGSLAHSERIADGVAGPSRRLVLRDCGHVPHRARPQDVLDAVADWLSGHGR